MTFTVFSHLASTRDRLCEFLAKEPLKITTDTFEGVMEQAKIVAAWEAGKVMRDCEVKRDSERLALNLPPELQKGELETAVKIYQRLEDTELTKYTTPSTP